MVSASARAPAHFINAVAGPSRPRYLLNGRARLVTRLPLGTTSDRDSQDLQPSTQVEAIVDSDTTPHVPKLMTLDPNEYFRPTRPPESLTSRAHIYRKYLQHLRLIPDPHVWNMMQPRIRELCQWPMIGSESADGDELKSVLNLKKIREVDRPWTPEEKKKALFESRAQRALKNARSELNKIRAAVACHPHAYQRLLEEAYGQRGKARWDLIRNITDSSPTPPQHPNVHLLTPNRPNLPASLLPLQPREPLPDNRSPVARTTTHPKAGKRKAVKLWTRQRGTALVPVALPGSASVPMPQTGWEQKGIVESVKLITGDYNAATRILEGDEVDDDGNYITDEAPVVGNRETSRPRPGGDHDPILPRGHELPTFANLSPRLQRIFPIKLKPTLREAPYPQPPPREQRQTPHKWGRPVTLRPRLVQRMYRRLWDALAWARPKASLEHGQVAWVRCSYEEMMVYERGEQLGGQLGEQGIGGKQKKVAQALRTFKPGRYSVATDEDQRYFQAGA